MGPNPKGGIEVRIHFPSARSRNIVKDGKILEYNKWDEVAKYYGPIKGTHCGENRYIGVKNIFEFYITVGCTLKIQPRDAIQTNLRLEWTFAEFFAFGGTTTFMDRVAASLGIHKSDVKVVSVYEGSLVVIYDIFDALNDPVNLEIIRKRQVDLFARDEMKLGVPILDVEIEQVPVIQDGVVRSEGY